MIKKLSEIVDEARRRGARRLAVAYGQDPHTLQAVADATREGIVHPIIFGSKDIILESCKSAGIDASDLEIIDESSDINCVRMAVKAVSEGKADVLMKGLVSTDKYMRGILDKEFGLVPPKGLLSHISVVELPGYPRLLTVGDVAVIPLPDLKQKTQIIKYLSSTARNLGVAKPLIAAIAPSEQLLPGVISSTEGAILSKMADRGQLGDIVLDGPLSLDVALYPEAAEEKKVRGSEVAGRADCLLFPNIESGNVFFKSATHYGGAKIAAMVVGTKAPCVLTSRGDTPETKLYSIALACIS